MNLMLRNADFLVCTPEQIEPNCDVLIEGTTIARVGHNLTVPAGTQELDARGCVVIPGLVNSHSHLYQNFLKGVAPDLTLVPWCNQVLFPTVGAIQEEFHAKNYRPAYLWSAIAGIEMIRGGITCCLNMDHMSRNAFVAWRDLGLRGVAAYTLANKWVPADLRGQERRNRERVIRFVEEFHQDQGLIQVALAPSTVFLCDDDLMRWARDVSQDLDLGVQIHVLEIADEVPESLAEYGLTPIERLDRLGLLNQRLSAVHCVHVTPQEINLLAERGVQVVHCPKSNMKLADGAAPVAQMRAAGIPVSVATDGCASNDLLDMWEEMRAALFLARVTNGDAAALTAADAFRMATGEGAAVCRFNTGKVLPGYLADLAVVELKGAHLRPFHGDRLMEMLVFCARAGDVRDTIINGQVVMRNRQITTMDEEAILSEAEAVETGLYRRRAELAYQHE